MRTGSIITKPSAAGVHGAGEREHMSFEATLKRSGTELRKICANKEPAQEIKAARRKIFESWPHITLMN